MSGFVHPGTISLNYHENSQIIEKLAIPTRPVPPGTGHFAFYDHQCGYGAIFRGYRWFCAAGSDFLLFYILVDGFKQILWPANTAQTAIVYLFDYSTGDYCRAAVNWGIGPAGRASNSAVGRGRLFV
jgi:hypothetical protein